MINRSYCFVCRLIFKLSKWPFFWLFTLCRYFGVNLVNSSRDYLSTVSRSFGSLADWQQLGMDTQWKVWFPISLTLNMAEELQRTDSNLKPSELKAAFKRSRDIDALLDEERELKEKEVQLLILGKHASSLVNSSVAIFGPLLGGINILSFYFQRCLTTALVHVHFVISANENTTIIKTTHHGWNHKAHLVCPQRF